MGVLLRGVVKITIDQHWAPEQNITLVERDTLSFYHTHLSQLTLSENKIVPVLFSFARETWVGNMEPRVSLDTVSHVVNVKTFFIRRKRRRRESKKKKKSTAFLFSSMLLHIRAW